MNDLQTVINKRAEAKLNAQLRIMKEFFHGNNSEFPFDLVTIFAGYKIFTPEGTQATLREFFWGDISSPASKIIKDQFLEKYHERETELFLAEIATLKEQATEFADRINDIDSAVSSL